MKPVIGITECSKYSNYQQWFKASGVEVIKLSYTSNNLADIQQCHGIVMSGGEDIHPEYYNRKEYLSECREINQKRDAFEWRVLEQTQQSKLPVLGICRGLQITNVFFGGTLIPDLQNRNKENHNSLEKTDRYHTVHVAPDTRLQQITNTFLGEINSSHHQAADQIGKGLKINALSPDHVIEGLEQINEKDPYVMLVQWHPERMNNLNSTFSKNIKQSFLMAAQKR